MGKIEQLELTGILSESIEKKNVAKKLDNSEAGGAPALEHKPKTVSSNKAPFKRSNFGHGFVRSLEKNSSDPKWREEQLEKFREINKRKDLL